ncbi:MAG: type II toxin-antitoxin system PemK/MazF family toxin [Metamycoplasmataceae bacterium]
MNKNKKWKSKKWYIVWISELKYNPYKNIENNKQRPVIIWNNSKKLKGHIIAFHCTTKLDPNNPYMYEVINNNENKKTWVNMKKIYFVKVSDIDWTKKLGVLKNADQKEKIINFINTFFTYN